MRFARKPGESALTDEILPMRLQNSIAAVTVDSDVCKPVMISTPFCTGTGFMKCVLMTREEADKSVGSEVVAASILVMEILEVLVARIACDGQMEASCLKMEYLSSGISYATVSSSARSQMSRSTHRHSFNDHVDLGQGVEGCVGLQSLAHSGSVLL